ncbi:effector-associated constant component EACC1 [Amycolatopsis sp. NPDC005003]
MQADIEVSGDDRVAEFGALWEWLRRERALAGAVHGRPKPATDGELGGAYEVLSVALGSGGAVVALANSLTTWLRSRRSDISVVVKTKAGSIRVSSRQVKSADEVAALLETVLRHEPES